MRRVTELMPDEEQRQRSRRRLEEEQPGMSVRRGLPESEVGTSVRQGLPEPDPSGIADKTPQLSVTKPLGRAFLANETGVIPAEILTDREEVRPGGGGGESSGEPMDISMEEMDRASERGQKRDREEEEGEADDEEYSARVTERLLGVVSQNGPPWYDADGMRLDGEKVKIGMDKERASLLSFPTYIQVDDMEPAKHGKKVIRSGCVLSGRGETIKARLVAQEVNYGDYMDVFAATSMSASLRVLLKIAMQRGWPVRLADLSTAFLYARLEEGELVYILPPQSERKKGKVWQLLRSWYGLRRSPPRFQEHSATVLKEAGFRRLFSDPQMTQMYVHEETSAIIVARVDDLMNTAPEDELPKVQEQLDKAFKVKWGATLGPTWAKFLGKEWRRRGDEIGVRIQEKYYNVVLKEHGLEKRRSLATPCVAQRNDSDDKPLEEDRRHRFRRTVGRLMWVAPKRPDLSFSVKEMARRVQAPTEGDWGTLKRILRYIRGTTTAELHLKLSADVNDDEVLAVTDASWASLADRRSTSRGMLWLGGMLIALWSRTQPVVTQSSCEAELIALSSGATGAKLIQSLLHPVLTLRFLFLS